MNRSSAFISNSAFRIPHFAFLPSQRRRAAFTLVEALVATSLTVLAGSAVLLALESSLKTTEAALEQTIAQGIAEQLLDEVAAAKYPPPSSTPQSPSGGSAPQRCTFDDIDDFHGYSSVPVDRFGRALGTGGVSGTQRPPALRLRDNYFTTWRATIEVFFVSDANFSQPLTGQTSNHRAVKVRVLATNLDGTTRQLTEAQRVFAYVPAL
jgi:type II secretory pathway pseudopilin PulG